MLQPLSGADLRRGVRLRLNNVVLTPHVTWYTADTMRRCLTDAVANCRRLCAGEPLATW